ncbi:MAG: M42 family metallopeptidase [Sedimentibacter saalensis]|jgi:endoglucanase|uniref:M42 family metallopeptidase n=1 Tax=Sedimentibacter saalensis TaxID=130788 RepID=UPI002B1F4DF9|nr:M42 family metallopeptidase [Sedimentibacter saalensis]MEA5094349.1 M42 family metallopeptidase [Sedimentibacter saalensis]
MFLKELTELSGVSGCEYEVRNYIKKKLEEIGCSYCVDKLGNVIAHNKGKKSKTIMVAAHMDEVGLIVTHIDGDGFIRFQAVGGIDPRVLNSKQVLVGDKKIPGIIGSKAVHLMSDDERGKTIPVEKLYIDIGSGSKTETEKLISIGDYVVFVSDYVEFGDSLIKAKALDDRAGCSAILELLSMKLDADFYGVFTVMEEVGCRGAVTAAYALEPDLGIVIEGTVCADMPGIDEHSKSTIIGSGAALSIMDNSTIYDIDIVRAAVKIAEENNISYQYRKSSAGGNDAGAIHKTKDGSKVMAISVPCRYIHSAVNVASKNDYNSVVNLTKAVIIANQKGE